MLELLLRDLNSRRKAIREAALKEARQLPPEQLLRLAEMEAQEHRRCMRLITVLWMFLLILWFLCIIEWWITRTKFNTHGFISLSFLNLIVGKYLPKRGHRSIASLLEQTQDIRLLGPALDLLYQEKTDTNVSKSVGAVLKRLLPELRADQTDMLTSSQKNSLFFLLRWPLNDVDLTLCILKALEQIGDEKAIPFVEQIANEPPKQLAGDFSPTSDAKRIQRAAQECLPYLRQNAERLQQAQTLLRASDASTVAAPDMLLRPAMASANTTPPEQLLRSSRLEK